jgi:hypothetical protein
MIPGGVPVRVPVSQYDGGTRQLLFSLWHGNQSFIVPSGATVTCDGTKPDGKGFSVGAEYSGFTVSVTLTEQMAAVSGDTSCQITVVDDDGILGSANFVLAVERGALGDDTVLSDSEYAMAQTLVQEATESARSAAESLEGIKTSMAEAGVSYETLQKAIDTASETNKTLTSTNSTATATNTALEESTSAANTAKTNLDASTKAANTAKSSLDESTTAADATKTSLDKTTQAATEANATATATNKTLTSTNTAASKTLDSLSTAIIDGNTVKSNLDSSTTAANSAKENLDESTTAADATKTSLDKTVEKGQNVLDNLSSELGISVAFTLTLPASGWNGKQQTVKNVNIVADGYSYIVAPDADSYMAYNSSGVRARNVTEDGQMTFECYSVPEEDLQANVVRIETG